MSIVTKKGDLGETSLASGWRVSKSNERVDTYGTLDELVSAIGLARNFVTDDSDVRNLKKLQCDLFLLGTELAEGKSFAPPCECIRKRKHSKKGLLKKHLNFLEGLIRGLERELPGQKVFIVPGESISSGFLHMARTVCRRFERKIVKLMEVGEFENPVALKYVNRLSDLLYLFARKSAGRSIIVLFSTAPNEKEAAKIADRLVEKGLIACANIVPNIRSVYKWKGRRYDEPEVLIVMKSTSYRLAAIKKELKKIHSYECPELIAVPIVGGLESYLDWVDKA